MKHETGEPTEVPSKVEELVADCVQAMEVGGDSEVDRICAEHPLLAEKVRLQLKRLADMGLLHIRPVDEVDPETIGPYSILQQIGTGGMGSVYLAEQRSPVVRKVAVKVIKVGMDTKEVVQRFRAEQQALALMDHPSIARVFDAGTTDAGRPYFVMEYVPGVSITSYCVKGQLTIDERLALFMQVCEAVQYAHQKGILHRDLKPSNILVIDQDGGPAPKVIDFGVAKATGPPLIEAALITLPGQIMGTPEYMSPEQAETGGQDIDTRADVYSLGVLLYEMLCGELPFDSDKLRSSGVVEMVRILRDETPRLPSTRVTKGKLRPTRAANPVERRLRGDLDWITMRALEKNRNRRYPSALALAEDIQRHLRFEPVLAGPPTWRYRVGKLVRRHRVEVGAALTVLLGLMTGIAFAVRYAMIANARAGEAELARTEAKVALGETQEFFYLASDAVYEMANKAALLRHVPGATPIRRQILGDALEFARKIQSRRPEDTGVKRFMLLQSVLTSELNNELGDFDVALAEAEAAVRSVDEMLSTDASAAELQRMRAVLLGNLATVHFTQGRYIQAREVIEEAVQQIEAVGDSTGIDDFSKNNLAAVWANYAKFLSDDGEAVLRGLRRAVALHESLAAPDLGDRYELLSIRVRFGTALGMAGDLDQAIEEIQSAIDELEGLDDHSERDIHLVAAYGALAHVHGSRSGGGDEALAAVRKLVETSRRVAASHLGWPLWQEKLADAISFMARLLDKDDESEKALIFHEEAIAIFREQRDLHPSAHLDWRFGIALCQYTVTLIRANNLQRDPARFEQALKVVEECMPILDALENLDLHRRIERENVRVLEASILDRLGRPEEGLPIFAAIIHNLEELLANEPTSALYCSYLAQQYNQQVAALINCERFTEAAASVRAGMEQVDLALKLSPLHAHARETRSQLMYQLGHIYVDLGDRFAAVEQANALAAEFPDRPGLHLIAAEIVARCVEEPGDEARREGWGALAVAHLTRASELGFQPEPEWPGDSPCSALRERGDFQALFPER